MMMVEAITRVEKLEDVKRCLAGAGINGFTISSCFGYGEEEGPKEQYRGRKYHSDLMERMKVEVVCGSVEEASDISSRLSDALSTGSPGDGMVFSFPLSSCTKIRK
ncbi:MAG: P-II family nitrogen regulator [Aeriscardovia sp.]|nr:P-II family nitrogen regulator [Aeriscardovia sp.]